MLPFKASPVHTGARQERFLCKHTEKARKQATSTTTLQWRWRACEQNCGELQEPTWVGSSARWVGGTSRHQGSAWLSCPLLWGRRGCGPLAWLPVPVCVCGVAWSRPARGESSSGLTIVMAAEHMGAIEAAGACQQAARGGLHETCGRWCSWG